MRFSNKDTPKEMLSKFSEAELDDMRRTHYAYHYDRNKKGSPIDSHSWLTLNKKSYSTADFYSLKEDNEHLKYETCQRCDAVRLRVRWGDDPMCCLPSPDIENILLNEEKSYISKLNESADIIKNVLKKLKVDTITPNALFILSTTYGYEPDLVVSAIGEERLIEGMMSEYEKLISDHKILGKQTSKWGK